MMKNFITEILLSLKQDKENNTLVLPSQTIKS